jgi:hypothetical protein
MKTNLGRIITVVGIAMAMVVATAGAALAAAGIGTQTCRSEANRYTICFLISQIGVSRDFHVHLGIDIIMSQRDAQNIIDAPGEEFSATLYGEDTFFDDTIKSFNVSWSSAWEGGLSAELDTTASGEQLDEDWDGDDELFAILRLYIPSTGATRSFRTSDIEDSFQLYT